MRKDIDKEDIKEEKLKKKSKSRLIILLISMELAIFMLFQTIQIIRYTTGSIDKKDAFLYNLIDSITKK